MCALYCIRVDVAMKALNALQGETLRKIVDTKLPNIGEIDLDVPQWTWSPWFNGGRTNWWSLTSVRLVKRGKSHFCEPSMRYVHI